LFPLEKEKKNMGWSEINHDLQLRGHSE
jgi:hypothetical protein